MLKILFRIAAGTCFALGVTPLVGVAGESEPAGRPNIVLFVSDDHGQDAGCYGNPVVKTPHLDQLAREGTLYRHAFCTTASCSASRSVILSGLHNHANGQFGHAHSFHHFFTYSSVRSLPVILAEHGYRTGRIGKLHVQPAEVYRFEVELPSAQGHRNPVRMAENCRQFVADRRAPFFLYFCPTDPHRSGQKVTDHPERPDAFGNGPAYAGVTEVVYDPREVIVPPWMPDNAASRAELAQYYQSVSRIDQGLGRLIQVLKETGQYENTLLIYTSDNGAAMPGSKTTLYEPGMRLPLVVRSPAAQRRGLVTSAMVSWVDFTPTILDFAGVREVLAPPLVVGERGDGARKVAPSKPERRVRYAFHGRSFRTTLEQADPEGWNEVFASHTFHEITMYYPMRVIRTDRYKLILNLAHPLPYPFASDIFESATWQSVLGAGPEGRYGKRRIADFLHRPRYELYDLRNDPDELVNLAQKPEYAETFQDLSARLRAFQERTGDPWVVKYQYE